MFHQKYSGVSRSELENRLATAEELLQKMKGGKFTIVIRMDHIGDNWHGEQTISYKEGEETELPPFETMKTVFEGLIGQWKELLCQPKANRS
jgi:hypothetical protein